MAMGAVMVLIGQRIFYDFSPTSKMWLWIYALNGLATIFIFPWAQANPLLVGALGGWANLALTMAGQIPQILYIHRNQSVQGFSFIFVVMMGMAGFFEFSTAYLAQLPIQTLVSAFRNMLVVVLFMVQFYLYRNVD